MQNFLSKKSKESDIKIRVVINSFSGNSIESDQSSEIMRILKLKKIKISEVLDINQELIFEKERKIHGRIREHYHQNGKIYKINSKLTLPQVIINESLVLSFEEFSLLNESRLIEKIAAGVICEHIRFFDNKIVYSHLDSEFEAGVCLYCYSQKKINQTLVYICNQRDYTDETNNEIFSFCEKNQIILKVIDYENENNHDSYPMIYKENLENKHKSLFIENELVSLENFYDVLEKRVFMFNKSASSLFCVDCGAKISADSSLGLKKCFECLLRIQENRSYANNSQKHNQVKNSKRNKASCSYSFIEKLGLKKKNFDFDYNYQL